MIMTMKKYFLLVFIPLLYACISPGDGGPVFLDEVTVINRFTIVDDHLYVLRETDLSIFDISGDSSMKQISNNNISGGSILQKENLLLISKERSLRIFSLNDSTSFEFAGEFGSINYCNEIELKDSIIFVVGRVSNLCPSPDNKLDLFSIKEPENLILIKSIALGSPRGLVIWDNLLFVCQGKEGLTVFDISNSLEPIILKSFANIEANDIVVENDRLLVESEAGFTQYNYINDTLLPLSFIPLE